MSRLEEERLTVSEVAKELGVSEKTIRGLIHGGELAAHRVTERNTRILRLDLDNFVQSHRTAQVTAGQEAVRKFSQANDGNTTEI